MPYIINTYNRDDAGALKLEEQHHVHADSFYSALVFAESEAETYAFVEIINDDGDLFWHTEVQSAALESA